MYGGFAPLPLLICTSLAENLSWGASAQGLRELNQIRLLGKSEFTSLNDYIELTYTYWTWVKPFFKLHSKL